jgi:hypothetical protein
VASTIAAAAGAAACRTFGAAKGDIALIWSVSSGLTNNTLNAPMAPTPATMTVRCAAVRRTRILPEAASKARNRAPAFALGASSGAGPIELGNIIPPVSAQQTNKALPLAMNADV